MDSLIAAFLLQTRLQGAILAGVQLQGAVLVHAELQAAMLYLAELQGANVRGAQLQGADVRSARFWQTTFWEGPTDPSNLGLADLRDAAWQPPDENDAVRIRENFEALKDDGPEGYSKERLERLIAPDAQSEEPPEFALDGVLLVDDVDDPRWQRLDRARLTTDERAYDEALVPFLADLARSDPHVARGLVRNRLEYYERGRAARIARGLLDRAGPALPEDVRERLSRIVSQPQPAKP
jgi:hypothetical protein